MRRLVQEDGQGTTIGGSAMGVINSSCVQTSVDIGGGAHRRQHRIGGEGDWVPQGYILQKENNVIDAG